MKFCELAGYIFDLDGTLLASTSLWHGVYARALAHFGIEMPDDYVEHVNHLNIEKGTEYTARRFGLTCGGEGVAKIWRKYAEEAYAHDVDLTPYARELLIALQGRGKKLAVATALDEDLARVCLSRHGVWEMFSAFVTVGDVGKDKSAPDVFLAAAAALGLTPYECAVVEDGEVGAASAKKRAFSPRGYTTRSAAATRRGWRRSATATNATSAAIWRTLRGGIDTACALRLKSH